MLDAWFIDETAESEFHIVTPMRFRGDLPLKQRGLDDGIERILKAMMLSQGPLCRMNRVYEVHWKLQLISLKRTEPQQPWKRAFDTYHAWSRCLGGFVSDMECLEVRNEND